MIGSVGICYHVRFARQIAVKTASTGLSTEKASQNTRTKDVGKRDTKRTAKRSVQAQEWSLDVRPHKSTKKAKAKERQVGRKEARDESWYCDKCAVEVAQFRCKYCGKSETEES